jgi:hypothetical protein
VLEVHGLIPFSQCSFNSILDAWAKSGGGRAAAERAEEILEWMDRLHKSGNKDVKPDTISYVMSFLLAGFPTSSIGDPF